MIKQVELKKETSAKEVSIPQKVSENIREVKKSSLQISGKAVYTREQVELIKRTVAKGATDDELKLFIVIANKAGLDPFTKQVHFVKRKSKFGEVGTVQTGIDGYLAIAERSKQLAGIEDAVYDTEADKHPNKATVTVYRIVKGARVPFTASARWKEYVPPAPMDFMWNKMPYLMLGKVALALALRKAFPNDLSGLYTNEEMEKTGDVVEVETMAPTKMPDPVLPTVKVDILDQVFEMARKFGAELNQEKEFIEKAMDMEIAWEKVDANSASRLKTQLMSKLTPR